MAGYSKTPLVQKLGIKDHTQIVLLNGPKQYKNLLGHLPTGAKISQALKPPASFIHYFVTEKNALQKTLPQLVKNLDKAGILWVSWPKGTSGLKKNLNETFIREYILEHSHLVDIKVCALDDDWSGLKFMWRKESRS